MKQSKRNWLTYLLYAVCGVIGALPCVFSKLWILGWLSYVPVLYNEYVRMEDEKRPLLKAWKRGFIYFYSYALVIFCWFVELYPLDFAGFEPLPALGVVLLAWLGIPILQAVPSALTTALLCLLKRKNIPLLLFPFAAAFLWVISEYTHTLTWLGVPWGKLAVGQTGNLYNIQSVSLFGSYFIGFIIALFAGFLTVSAVQLRNKESLKKCVMTFLCAIVIFEANNIYGRIALAKDEPVEESVTVAAIQANIASDEKWDNTTDYTLTTYRELSLAAADEGAKLIVWPETAFPYRLNRVDFIAEYTEEIARDGEADIIIGCFHGDDSDTLYNVTRFVSHKNGLTDTMYSKRRLVPFGEFVPMRKIIMTVFPPLAEVSMLSQDITAGTSSSLFHTEYGKVGSLICFDSIYEKLALATVRDGAELLAISTNDSWFHDSTAVYQHNSHAILRSVETGRYTVRSANTGISSIITNKGEVTDMLPPLVQGYVLGEVKYLSHSTLYSVIGNSIVPFSAAGFAAIALFCFIRKRKYK